jgi:hypothetical protein
MLVGTNAAPAAYCPEHVGVRACRPVTAISGYRNGQTAVVCVPYDALYFLDCCGPNRESARLVIVPFNTGCLGAALRSRLMDAVRHNAPE